MMRSGSRIGSGRTYLSSNGWNKRLLKRSKQFIVVCLCCCCGYNVSAPRPHQGKRIWGKDRRLSR
eukprot:9313174-Ditylum_brightwellii.AAC.1